MSEPIVIVGAGIGGLATALALAQKGVPSRVIERAAEIREVGAGVQAGPNAFRAFDQLGIAEEMDAISFRPTALRLIDSLTGEELSRQTLGAPFEARFRYPYRVAFRADVQQVLLQAVSRRSDAIQITLGDGLDAFEPLQGGVLARLESGASVRGRGLVGADGIRSRVRQQLLGENPLRHSGYVAYRAVAPVAEFPDHVLTDDTRVFVGPAHHMVCYKLRRGELFNIVAIFRSDHADASWDATGSPTELMAGFAGVSAEVHDLLQQIRDWKVWGLYDRDPRPGWSQGLVTLLGDAAHPMLPYLAQGACMAIEDAVVLADQVAAGSDIAQAFSAYEQARYPRTSAVQLAARRAGEINHAAGAAREARNATLARQPSDDYEAAAWLFDGQGAPVPPPEQGYGVFSRLPAALDR
jgi:2-polyprenyl-6-methoxyphenol hydroxylase-like FAD-dependent oxidoreductase